jgi:hypothetical protein
VQGKYHLQETWDGSHLEVYQSGETGHARVCSSAA